MTTTTAGRGRRTTTTDLALIATFAALLAVCSVAAALPIGVNGVPITLQMFAVFLTGAVLGAKRGFLAVLLYLALGAAGLPIFAGGVGGLAPFSGPTGGCLIAFPFAAAIVGFAVEQAARRGLTVTAVVVFAAGVVAEIGVWLAGSVSIAVAASMSYPAALKVAAAYIPADLVKLAIAAIVAAAVHRAFPALLSRR